MIKALLPRWTERPKCLFLFFFFICHVLTNCNLIMQASFYTNKKEIYFFNFVPPLSPQLLFLKFYIKKKKTVEKDTTMTHLKLFFRWAIRPVGLLLKKKNLTPDMYQMSNPKAMHCHWLVAKQVDDLLAFLFILAKCLVMLYDNRNQMLAVFMAILIIAQAYF